MKITKESMVMVNMMPSGLNYKNGKDILENMERKFDFPLFLCYNLYKGEGEYILER